MVELEIDFGGSVAPTKKRDVEEALDEDSPPLKKKKAHYGSRHASGEKDSVATPPDLVEALKAIYKCDFDPCPLNPAWNAQTDVDGLKIEWQESNFVNPPYSQLKAWVSKGIEQFKKGRTVIMLIPNRTDTNYWHELIWPNITGYRPLSYIQFPGYTKKSPVPIAILEFVPGKKPLDHELNP